MFLNSRAFPTQSQPQTNAQINHEVVTDETNETDLLETTSINNLDGDAIDEGEILYYEQIEPMDYIQFLPIATEKR